MYINNKISSISSSVTKDNFQILYILDKLAKKKLLIIYFEKIFAFLLLLILSPIILIILLLVSIDLRMNPIFIQKRGLTLEKEIFFIYKIRTIKGKEHRNINSLGNKEEINKYITFLGRILRKSGFDEILQLINIIKGEMHFIGPRPLSFYDLYMMAMETPILYERRNKINLKPGITGYWQIFGKSEKGFSNLIKCDEFYNYNNSFSLNLKIVFNTIKKIVTFKHIDSILRND